MNNFDFNNIELFNEVSTETKVNLTNNARIHKYKKGEYLFFNKDEIDEIYFIISGKVTLFRYTQKSQKRIIYILGKNEFINEVIFDSMPSSINVEAFEDTVVAKYPVKVFKEMMAKDYKLAEIVINSLGRKVRRLYRQIKNTVPIKLDKRVAAKLWKLSKDYGVDTHDDWTFIDLKITITYLADMLGSSREAISREIKKLENQGLISWKNRKLKVKRRELSNYFKER